MFWPFSELGMSSTFAEICFVFAITVIVSFVLRRVVRYLDGVGAKHPWIRMFSEALLVPARLLIWGYFGITTLEIICQAYTLGLPEVWLSRIRGVFFILGASWVLFRWKAGIESELITRTQSRPSAKGDKTLIEALSRLVSIAILTLTALTTLDTLNVSITALLAVGSIGTFAVSWAGKDIIANFFGGLMIYIKRPFTVGDWIMSPNKNFEGTAEEIGWYMTRIRTFERRPMYIPNASLIDAIIENPSRMYNRRIKHTFGVRYSDVKAVDTICKEVEMMLQGHPEIDQNQILMVHFVNFGTYSLDINIYTFTKTTDWAKWRDVQQDVLLRVADIVDKNGAEIAFPTQTLQMEGNEVGQLTPARV